ncbi:MAG: hypothetical protein Q9198_003678 [Flavoplaca austrocitrina]
MDDCGQLLGTIGSLLLPIMEENIEPLSIIQHKNKLEIYYRNLDTLRSCNEIGAAVISNLAFQNPTMRILDVGGGPSTATTAILEALGSRFLSYHFTDVTMKYLDNAREACNAWDDKTNEPTATLLSDIVVFGSLPNWYCGDGLERQDGSQLTESQWDNLLETTGFSGIDASVQISPSGTNIASVILSSACSKQPPVSPKAALLTCGVNEQGLVQAVIDQVATVTDQPQITTGHLTSVGLDNQCGIVLALATPFWSDLTEDDLKTMQRLIASACGFLWITRDAEATNPVMNMVSGFARTKRVENGSDLSRLTWTHVIAAHTLTTDGANDLSSTTHTVRHLLKQATTLASAIQIVGKAISQQLASLLMISADDMDGSKPVVAYGLDTLAAVELRNWITSGLEANVPLIDLMNSPSIEHLAGKIVGKSRIVEKGLLDVEEDRVEQLAVRLAV